MPKYIHAITGEKIDEEMKQRVTGPRIRQLSKGVYVTEEEIVARHYNKRLCMPYAQIVWAYRQVATSHMKILNIKGMLSEHRIICRNAEGKSTMIVFDHEKEAKDLLKLIENKNPACAIGCTPQNKKRFGVGE